MNIVFTISDDAFYNKYQDIVTSVMFKGITILQWIKYIFNKNIPTFLQYTLKWWSIPVHLINLADGSNVKMLADTTNNHHKPWDIGCTDSLAWVKRDSVFRGPPSALCFKWSSFNSERVMNLFNILTNCTSTMNHFGLSLAAELLKEIVHICQHPENVLEGENSWKYMLVWLNWFEYEKGTLLQ